MKQKDVIIETLKKHLEEGYYANIAPGNEMLLGVTRKVFNDAIREMVSSKEYKTMIINLRGGKKVMVLVPADTTERMLRKRFGMIEAARMVS